MAQIFSISCNFSEKFGKIVCWRPLLEGWRILLWGILDPPLIGVSLVTEKSFGHLFLKEEFGIVHTVYVPGMSIRYESRVTTRVCLDTAGEERTWDHSLDQTGSDTKVGGSSGESRGGAPGTPPLQSNFFAISCSFFGTFWQNCRLAPPPGGLAPLPTGNPGSAPAS